VKTRFTVTIGKSKSFFLKSDFDIFRQQISYSGNTNFINDWTMSSQLIYQNHKSHGIAGFKYQRNLYKDITAQGYNAYGNDYWIVFVQQPLLKNELNIMLLYFLPVNLGTDYNQATYIKTNNYTGNTSNDISFLKNMILLQVSYRFNKGKSVNKTEKNIEQENEQNKKSVF
jgi:hypothetical protein